MAEEPCVDAPQLCRLVDALGERYPGIHTAWLFGSQVDGRARVDSDFDIILTFQSLERPYHEFVEWNGAVLDLHCHTLESLDHLLSHQRSSRMCFYARALSHGTLLTGGGSEWNNIRSRAASILGERIPVASWDSLRFNITSKLGDLRSDDTFANRLFVTSELQRHLLCIFALRKRGWLARVDVMRGWLDEDDPMAGARFDRALQHAIEGDQQDLRELTLSALDLIGGPARSGERAYVQAR